MRATRFQVRLATDLVERERAHVEALRARYLELKGSVPRWVEHGMGAGVEREEQVRHRVQMLLGIFAARGVLALELKPVYSIGHLVVQHPDELEREAETTGGVEQVLADHFAKVFRLRLA